MWINWNWNWCWWYGDRLKSWVDHPGVIMYQHLLGMCIWRLCLWGILISYILFWDTGILIDTFYVHQLWMIVWYPRTLVHIYDEFWISVVTFVYYPDKIHGDSGQDLPDNIFLDMTFTHRSYAPVEKIDLGHGGARNVCIARVHFYLF